MSFPQSKLEDWAKQMGETHGEWVAEVIRDAYITGYTDAFPHAAKHTAEKILKIVLEKIGRDAEEEVRMVLTMEKWKP